jgi:hypothetical protein
MAREHRGGTVNMKAGALVIVLAAAGCGSSPGGGGTARSSSPSPSPTPTVQTISEEATCTLSFDDVKVVGDAISAWSNHKATNAATVAAIKPKLDRLQTDVSAASPSLRPWLQTIAAKATEVHDALANNIEKTIQLDDFRVAGIQYVTICEKYLSS